MLAADPGTEVHFGVLPWWGQGGGGGQGRISPHHVSEERVDSRVLPPQAPDAGKQLLSFFL